jgi:hypothetical protein
MANARNSERVSAPQSYSRWLDGAEEAATARATLLLHGEERGGEAVEKTLGQGWVSSLRSQWRETPAGR